MTVAIDWDKSHYGMTRNITQPRSKAKTTSVTEEVFYVLNHIAVKPAPAGYRWVFTRFRRVKNSTRLLDAHTYGYQAWAFLVKG